MDTDMPGISSFGRPNCIKLPGINKGMPNATLCQSLPCKISSHSLSHSVQSDLHAGSVKKDHIIFNTNLLPTDSFSNLCNFIFRRKRSGLSMTGIKIPKRLDSDIKSSPSKFRQILCCPKNPYQVRMGFS